MFRRHKKLTIDDDMLDIFSKTRQSSLHPPFPQEQNQKSFFVQASQSKPKFMRLKKKVTEKMCMICLNAIPEQDYAQLKSCHHEFCYDCILGWAKQKNTCPVCRFPFSLITRSYQQLIKLYFYRDNACVCCRKNDPEGELVPCLKCQKRFIHRRCSVPPLIGQEQEWNCEGCLNGSSYEDNGSGSQSLNSSSISASRDYSLFVMENEENEESAEGEW